MVIGKYITKFGETLEELSRKESSSDKPLVDQIESIKDLFPKGAIFRRAGTTAGVVVPYVGAYVLSDYVSTGFSNGEMTKELYIMGLFCCSSAIATLFGVPILTGRLGYKAGKKLDNLIDKASSKVNKCKYARRQENYKK